MKKNELKKLSAKDLESKLAEAKGNLSKLKMAHAISPLQNPMSIRNTKRLVAKLNTLISAK